MLRKIAPLFILIALAGCESSTEEKGEKASDTKTFQLHATALQGTNHEVIALEKLDTLYHLFYATNSKLWGHLTSTDLQNWQLQEALELEEGTQGVLAINPDQENRLPARWNRLEQNDGELFLFRSIDGVDWEGDEENPVLENVKGKISVTWDQAGKRWILTETSDEKSIRMYSSADWKDWTAVGTLNPGFSLSRAAIYPLKDSWLLQTEGSSIRWFPLNQTSDAFELAADTSLAEYHGIENASVYQGRNETILIATHAEQSKWTPTFSLPVVLNYQNGTFEFDQPDDLKANLIAKRRGLLSKLKAEGPSQYTIRLPKFDNTARLDLMADSVRLGSLFLDKNEQLIKCDRSLAPVGESQSISFSWNPPEEPIMLDLIIDTNTYDLMLNKGRSFSGTIHLGSSNPATQLRWFADETERDVPGALLTYQLRKL